MPKPQSGILPEASPAALFITLKLSSASGSAARAHSGCRAFPRQAAELAAEHPEANLVSVIGVGSNCWGELFQGARPRGLHPFVALEHGARRAPTTPADLFLHIRSARNDLNFLLARKVMEGFGDSVEVVEEVTGFRYLDGRDLTGFVDGTENPGPEERPTVAIVSGNESENESGDPAFAGGSYIHIQRYVHDLTAWEQLKIPDQEMVIGRTKADDREMDDETKPATAHIHRVDIKEDGHKVEILRHSMPYGDTTASGLYFVSYGASPEAFEKMLERMIRADGASHYDHLLQYTEAVTGAAFFAPSQEFLEEFGA